MYKPMFYVYMLRCKDSSFYVGHTDDLERRLGEHSAGQSSYTSNRLPVVLVYSEWFQSRDEAFSTEHKIKSWSRKKKEALLSNDWALISSLSKKKF